jgi:hypothetical protein
VLRRAFVREAVAAAFGVAVAVIMAVVVIVAVVAAVLVAVAVIVMPVLVAAPANRLLSLVSLATRAVSAASRPLLVTRTQALRNAKPRQEAMVHRRSLPKVTQSLNSL